MTETEKIIQESDVMKRFVDSEGWIAAKMILMKKIATLDSISSIPMESPDDMVKQMMYRSGAISLVLEWMREVEGIAQQGDYLRDIERVKEDEIIRSF